MPQSSVIFETVFTEGVAHLSYQVGDKSTGQAAVIDPRRVEGRARYGFAHRKLRDDTRIELGRCIPTAKHTLGRTPEHVSFLVAEDRHPDDPFAVLSGDVLFADSVGRADLLGAAQAEDVARRLPRSIRNVYLLVKDQVIAVTVPILIGVLFLLRRWP